MQLKFKKIFLLGTIIVYCASFLLQSDLGLFQAWAKEVNTPRVNIVAILVDDKIYNGISDDLNWYATSYIQDKLRDTKALVMPLNLDNIDAYDIYRMMQNIYFDGLKDVNSQLIGLIMIGTIPFPVVNQNGYMFPTVYPYVDFENPKYYWDENTKYFVPAGNSKGQAEVWHGLIDYGQNIDLYKDFFEKKLMQYHRNKDYAKKKIWYEDFIAQKNAFLKENFKYYRNRVMFGEDLGYQRYSPLMKKMFGAESAKDSKEVVEKAFPGVEGYGEVQDFIEKGAESMHTTKLTQQEIDTSYVSDYNELFSDTALSKMRENIFAGGRWIRESLDENGRPTQIVDADSSMSKIQLLDTLYLGDGDLKGILETWNLMLEDMIDKKINDNRYDMDIVIPVSYSRITGMPDYHMCHHLTRHFDNYYFGNNARYINKASDLSVYRGTYRNLLTLTGVTYDSLLTGNNPVKGEYDPVKFKFKSIGASYGIFSTQVEGNRGFNVLAVERDLDIRDEMKTLKDAKIKGAPCDVVNRILWPRGDDDDEAEALTGSFIPRMWGGASPANLDPDSIPTGKYKVYNYKATDAWRPIFDMGGFQSLLSGDDEGMEGTGWIIGGPGPQWAGTSFKSYIKYSSPTERMGWEGKYLIYANHYPNVHKTFDEVDFFKLGAPLDWSPKRSGEFFTLTYTVPLCVDPMKEWYEYKVIRSINKHTSTTEEELKGVTEDEINGIDRDKTGSVATLSESYGAHLEGGNKEFGGIDAYEIREDLADAKGRTFHLSGMNLMTPDRPIDSPRYISMQSVAGNEIKFIYPDLFKVEVFAKDGEDCDPPGTSKIERHVLKGSGVRGSGGLNDAIKKYLQGKVDEYNKILEEECNKALEMDKYFNKLKELGYDMATPNKGIHGCGVQFTYKEFIKALAGADDDETERRLLNVIGDVLYYQNVSNKEKLRSGNVAGDIDFIKKSFDVNNKRDEVLYRFLHYFSPAHINLTWNYASSSEHQIVLPNQINGTIFNDLYLGGGGYEVAYVNSNNQDSLFPDLDYREDDNEIKTKDYADLTKGFSQSSKMDTDIRDECNIPVSGRLPIFGSSPTWLEGFKCWLKKTKEQPLKIKLSFDGSLGEVLEYDSLSDYLKNSDLGQSFDNWKDSMGRFAKEWDKILNPDTTFDADKGITQMQVKAEKHNKDVVGANEGGANLMSSIYKDVRIENTNDLLSDSNPYSELSIEALYDIGSISIQFVGTGDGCLKLNGTRLEKGSSMTETLNIKTNPFKGVVETCEEHVAGKTAIDIKMSVGGEYIEKVLKYTVAPSELERAEIKVLDEKTVAGMISPVKVIGYDKYNNVVDWGMEKYKFTTTQGRFLKDGSYQDSFTTNDFRDLNFYLQVPLDADDNSIANIKITNLRDETIKLACHDQPIVQASPEISLNGGMILKGKTQLESSQSHQLHPVSYPEWASNITEVIYKGDELDLSILQKLDIDMKDNSGKLIDLDSQILVTSNNGLVVIGEVKQDENGKNYFFETNTHYMVDGHVTLYYYFSTVAGDEIINIDIPGLDLRKINLKITPAVADKSKVQVNVDRGYIPVGGDSDIEVLISDMYGNRVSGASTYDNNPRLVSLPSEFLRDMCYDLCVPCDNATVIIPNDGYLIGKAHGERRGVDPLTIAGSENRIVVDGPLFPEDNVNVMYLNYFGDDRGNQWGYFSDNNKHMEKIMSDSIIMLAVTTQLISEDKIKRMMWKIQPKFQIANYDGISTRLSIKDGKIKMDIGGSAILNTASPSFTLMTATQNRMSTILSNEKTASKNYLFFIPNNENYDMDSDGTLYSGDKVIGNILNGEITLQMSKDTIDNGDNIWDIVGKGSNFGSFVVHYPGYMPSVGEIKAKGRGYMIASTFSNGSTKNLTSVGVFDKSSEFELDTSYKSIQNSDEIDEGIGFVGDFKNITLFAEGEYVGEATRKFGSEFVINLGDPLLTVPIDEPGPISNPIVPGGSYEGGLGNEIYVDTEKDIFKTYEIDFNNDGNVDLLVIYTDGTIKLSKSYGNTPELRNMQELFRLAVPMKDVFVGDADGNGYDDVIVLTENNQLRAYLNNGGVFDVDGSVACLNQNVFEGEISSTPSNLEGVMQIFLEDMNNDKYIDVVTYDRKGYIKVFFGGNNNGGPNYLSTEKYTCDPLWYARESSTMTVVTTLGVQIADGEKIYDNSLITWPGLEKPEKKITEDELPDYGIKFNPKMLEPLIKSKERGSDGNIGNVTTEIMEKFNFKTASQKITDEGAEFVDISSYDEDGTYTTRTYIPISFLDYQDIHKVHCDPKTGDCFKNEPDIEYQCKDVYKQYFVKSGGVILQDGDIVTVQVNLNCEVDGSSFIDTIEGPWNVYYDENGKMQGVRLDGAPGAIQKEKNGDYDYTINNIPKGSSSFQYDLEYHQIPLRKISVVRHTFYGEGPYIKVQSIDGCEKDFEAYSCAGFGCGAEDIELKEMIDKEYKKEEKKTEDYAEDVIKMGSNVNQITGVVKDSIDRIIVFDENGASINLDVFGDKTKEIETAIDTITKGMCNGFKFGGSQNCKGFPVPFNQAFLAPGKYHLFGCRNLPVGPLEGGIPVFFFPGTIYIAEAPVPFPWGLKNAATDKFLWASNGVYPSFIRIYAAPTMTAQLGVAICMGKYMDENILPSPLSDVAGNCIIFTVKPQCKSDALESEEEDSPVQIYPEYIEEVRDSGACMQSAKGPLVTLHEKRSSPFNLNSFSASRSQSNSRSDFNWRETGQGIWGGDGTFLQNLYNNMDVNGGSNNGVEYSTSFLGIIELETNSFVGPDDYIPESMKSSIVIGDVDILGGDYKVNKIKGGIQQGIRKLLIDNWLDPQIRYIANQLTKMHILIKFPDLSNLLDYEAQTMKNVSQNIGTIWNNDEESRRINPISNWDNINYDNLTRFNKTITNPFEALASLMNQSNIINISMQTLNVKIPMIFKEDIDAYEFYLQQWLDTNDEIVKEWRKALETFVTDCSEEPDPEACRIQRNENLASFIHFQDGDWKKMQNQIYANLIVLQKYREFPFEIYEWIHVIDRYMAEIASLISNTIGYLSFWTSVNAERFAGYVDAIVLIINIIKTYQLLIDFSVNWSENCGNCAKDTYDQYSCKLSFLCNISLPILQIPNFKLPNITIDLTDIDLSLDIVLPEFNFQPIRIDLPELPNLPEPPSISLNIKLFDLPNIPVLPDPPELPELPSFIPEIELELPILPPAPEIPKLPNSIESLIDLGQFIGKIYCIVKGNFGLVGESSVKAKIEQLTQRTYEVDWIDNIMDFTNLSIAPIHNFGVDYEIDSIVDFQFSFTDFYDYLDTLTKGINNLTTSTVSKVNKATNAAVKEIELSNPLEKIRDAVDGKEYDANLDLTKITMAGDMLGVTSDDIEYVDYESGRERLKEVLAHFKHEVSGASFSDSFTSSLNKIENQIDRHSQIEPNVEGIVAVGENVMDYLDKQKVNYDTLADTINSDYNSFLAMVDSQSKLKDKESDNDKLLAFNVQLFNPDSIARDSIDKITKNNPYDSILDNKKTIIDGYRNAVNTNSADSLGISESQYLVLRNSISVMRNKMNGLYTLTKSDFSTDLLSKDGNVTMSKNLVAGNGYRIGSQEEVGVAVDAALVSKGIYDKYRTDKKVKVVYSDSFAERMMDRHYLSKRNDIILWDGDAIFRKALGGGSKGFDYLRGTYKKYYVYKIDKIPYEEYWIEFDKDTILKIGDVNQEVKKWDVSGQNYDVLYLTWQLSSGVDAYLIKLTERIDDSYEKADYSGKAKVHYLLALPAGTELEDIYANNTKLELLNKKIEKIKDIYGEELPQVVYYDPSKNIVSIGIYDVERKWYYARISTLNLYDNVYNITSPWSNQIVAGRQVAGDEQTPEGRPILYRYSVPEITSEGDDLEGYVGTYYKLIVNWEDNVALSYINISKGGKVLTEKYTYQTEDTVSINLDLHTKSEKEIFSSMGIDQFGNKTEKQITVSYYIPEITITDVSKNPDGESVTIKAELSQDIDQGNVSFQRRRGEVWKSMKRKGIDCADIPIGVGDWIVRGTPYSAGNDIAMYDKNNEVIALMNPDTAEIKIQPGYVNDYEVNVKVENSVVLQVCKKSDKTPVFSVSMPIDKCDNFEGEGYKVVDLPEEGRMGMFNGGKAIYNNGNNVLIVSPTCRFYSELGLEGEYSYDKERALVLLTLYEPSDFTKSHPIKTWLKVKPLLEENK